MQIVRTTGALAALAALAALVIVVPCHGQEAGPSPKETIQSWAKAFTAKDPADLLRFYAQSEDLIWILSGGQQHKGYAALKKEYEKGFAAVAIYESEVTELDAHQVGGMAWATCRHRAKLRVLADDTKVQLEVRTTFALTRDKSGWRIVVEHSSPIADVPRMRPLP